MATEAISPRFHDLDLWPTADAVDAMLEGQIAAAASVRAASDAIARAIDEAAARLRKPEGRLVYIGAGTSGRIAIQDGVELGPTFDWPDTRLVYLLAGGLQALTVSSEDAEDDAAGAAQAVDANNLGPADVAIGVAASGRTPFTVSAIERARARGALTIGVAGNPDTRVLTSADHPILLKTGAEVLAGSTRMKAGTAQKIALNLISTGIMLRLGRIHRGLMVNMRMSNAKLRERAVQMVAEITGCPLENARAAMAQSDGSIKRAVLIASGASITGSADLLDRHADDLRRALNALQSSDDQET